MVLGRVWGLWDAMGTAWLGCHPPPMPCHANDQLNVAWLCIKGLPRSHILFDRGVGGGTQQAGKEAGEGSSTMSGGGSAAAGSQRGSAGAAAWFTRKKPQAQHRAKPAAYVRAGSRASSAETQRAASRVQSPLIFSCLLSSFHAAGERGEGARFLHTELLCCSQQDKQDIKQSPEPALASEAACCQALCGAADPLMCSLGSSHPIWGAAAWDTGRLWEPTQGGFWALQPFVGEKQAGKGAKMPGRAQVASPMALES